MDKYQPGAAVLFNSILPGENIHKLHHLHVWLSVMKKDTTCKEKAQTQRSS